MIHIYCGDGKGKTTASIGMAVRMAGYGKKVLFAQFLKGSPSGETTALPKSGNITVLRCAKDYGFFNTMSEEDKANVTRDHNENLRYAVRNMNSFDMIILDEIFSAYSLGLTDKEQVKCLLEKYSGELVLTGRSPDKYFIDRADYVSEIKKIKHPFDSGTDAREGIEY